MENVKVLHEVKAISKTRAVMMCSLDAGYIGDTPCDVRSRAEKVRAGAAHVLKGKMQVMGLEIR